MGRHVFAISLAAGGARAGREEGRDAVAAFAIGRSGDRRIGSEAAAAAAAALGGKSFLSGEPPSRSKNRMPEMPAGEGGSIG